MSVLSTHTDMEQIQMNKIIQKKIQQFLLSEL